MTAFAAQASGRVFDFKGVRLGEKSSPEAVQQALGAQCGKGYNDKMICNGTVTVAGETANMNLVIGTDGLVQRINLTLDSAVYDSVAAEVLAKFGRPNKTDNNQVQNRMGARFMQTVMTWTNARADVLQFTRYAGGTVTHSMLSFTTKADRDFLDGQGRSRRAGDI